MPLTPSGERRSGRGQDRRDRQARLGTGWLRRCSRRARAFAHAHPILVIGVLLAALDLALVYPAVLGGRVLGPEDSLLFNAPLDAARPASLLHASNYLLTDVVEVFHPDLEWARSVIRAGRLPLWDPYIFDGWPMLASQQTAILYPLNMIAYVMPFWSALGVIAVLKTLVAGLGAWWLCRRLRLGVAAASLGAVTYSLGSYFVIWLEHPQTNVYALIPWLLGAIELLCARRRPRDAAIVAGLVGLCLLGGHPESTFIAGLGCVAFAVLCLAGLSGPGERRRAGLLLLGAVLWGLAAGAVMIVPFAQLAAQAPMLARGGGAGLPDRSMLSLLLPDLWGRPDRIFEYGGPANYAERTFYVGALPLLLAVAGLYRLRSREQRFFVGLLLGAGVLAVHVPLLTSAIDNLPVFADVALPRSLILVALSLAMLAAFGLQRLLDASARERRLMLGVAATATVLPLVWFVRDGALLDQLPRFADLAPSLWGHSSTKAQAGAAAATRWLVFSLLGLAVLGWLARCLRGGRSRRATLALTLTVGLVAVDLVTLNHGFHPAIPQALAAPPAAPTILSAQADAGSGRTLGYNEYLIPNVASRYGLRDPRGHGLPVLRRYLALWTGLGGQGFQDTRLRPKDPRAGKLLDDFGVTVVLASPHQGAPPGRLLRFVSRHPDGVVYANPQALPRAYVATSWRPAASRVAALTATVRSDPVVLRLAPVIEGVGPAPNPRPDSRPAGSATFTRDDGDFVSLDVDAAERGYLVLLDTYYPGWSATVDGHAIEIHAANEAFRAVAIPPGHHTVVFRYRPRSLLAAAILSAVAWLALLVVASGRPRGRRPDRGARLIWRGPLGFSDAASSELGSGGRPAARSVSQRLRARRRRSWRRRRRG